VIASSVGETHVIGARVFVITGQRTGPHAQPVHAAVFGGAGVSVVTGAFGRFLETPLVWKTSAGGAGIAVVTGKGRTSQARPLRAEIVHRAHIVVITRLLVWCVGAPGLQGADVVCARVAVVAGDRLAPLTDTARAGGVYRAEIAIVAQPSFIGRLGDAHT